MDYVVSSQSWAIHAANLSCLSLKRSSPFRPDLALDLGHAHALHWFTYGRAAPRADSRALVITSSVCYKKMRRCQSQYVVYDLRRL